MTLAQVLPEVLNFVKEKKKEECVSSLLFLMTMPAWDFNITPYKSHNICLFSFSFEIKPEIIKLGLPDRWLEKVKGDLKTVAYCVCCYLFNMPDCETEDIYVSVSQPREYDYDKDGQRRWCLTMGAFLKNLEVLRIEVFHHMVDHLEDVYGKAIEEILVGHQGGLNSEIIEELGRIFRNPKSVNLSILSRKLDLLEGIKEWKNLKEILIKEGLIDEFCNPKVPVRDISRKIKALGSELDIKRDWKK